MQGEDTLVKMAETLASAATNSASLTSKENHAGQAMPKTASAARASFLCIDTIAEHPMVEVTESYQELFG